MTRTELENSMNDIFQQDNGLNHYYGNGYYWRQVASQIWHDNINNVQTKYNVVDFVCTFFEVALVKVNREDVSGYVMTLTDFNQPNFERR